MTSFTHTNLLSVVCQTLFPEVKNTEIFLNPVGRISPSLRRDWVLARAAKLAGQGASFVLTSAECGSCSEDQGEEKEPSTHSTKEPFINKYSVGETVGPAGLRIADERKGAKFNTRHGIRPWLLTSLFHSSCLCLFSVLFFMGGRRRKPK